MKYRRLRREELEELQPQFVRFLAAQGIPAEDWQKLKIIDENRTEALLDQFSAMVYDGVIGRIEYLEQRTRHQLLALQCGRDKIELRGIIVENEPEFDFRQNLPPADMMAALQNTKGKLKLASAERIYRPDRPTELFKLLEDGAKISSSSELYNLLDQLANANSDA